MSLLRFLQGTRSNPPPLHLDDTVVERAIAVAPDLFARGDIPYAYALVYEREGPRAAAFLASSPREQAAMVARFKFTREQTLETSVR